MIDIEKLVYTTVHDAIKAEYPNCTISDEPPELAAKFPHVTIRETGNRTYAKTQDNDPTEHHAKVVYDIDVYSDKQNGRKKVCKAILDIADRKMQEMLFTRVLKNELPTINRTIMRLKGRYEAVVEEPEIVGGDTTFQMYRG